MENAVEGWRRACKDGEGSPRWEIWGDLGRSGEIACLLHEAEAMADEVGPVTAACIALDTEPRGTLRAAALAHAQQGFRRARCDAQRPPTRRSATTTTTTTTTTTASAAFRGRLRLVISVAITVKEAVPCALGGILVPGPGLVLGDAASPRLAAVESFEGRLQVDARGRLRGKCGHLRVGSCRG